MRGIDLNQPLEYWDASFRYFKEQERHSTRTCVCDVLLLVFDGVLRFSEDGVEYELHPGQYHIQKKGSYQTGTQVSDAPKYLYLHFVGTWTEEGSNLPFCGTFDLQELKPSMTALDELCHGGATKFEQLAQVYEIFAKLSQTPKPHTVANEIAGYLEEVDDVSLQELSEHFHFSKNHIINLFKAEYGMTPVEYANDRKLRKAERLLEVTSDSVKQIADGCGFHDYAYFYKLFCRKHGVSPLKWRQARRK